MSDGQPVICIASNDNLNQSTLCQSDIYVEQKIE
jgi:hypothetical protein